MSRGEADRMFRRGIRFFLGIGMNANNQAASAEKALRMQSLNARYNARGVTFNRGFHTHEHHVRIAGAGGTYLKLCQDLAGEADGGIASARAVRDWYSTDGGNRLSQLAARPKMLAVLSHFSEPSRGYGITGLRTFRRWIERIADAPSPAEARNLWLMVNQVYPPSLTYKQDAEDFEDIDIDADSDSDSDSGSDEDLSEAEEMDIDPNEGP